MPSDSNNNGPPQPNPVLTAYEGMAIGIVYASHL
jgi:hypothetical protein